MVYSTFHILYIESNKSIYFYLLINLKVVYLPKFYILKSLQSHKIHYVVNVPLQ
jgi:hypothetical protein